jgi:segregation and condensation protein A
MPDAADREYVLARQVPLPLTPAAPSLADQGDSPLPDTPPGSPLPEARPVDPLPDYSALLATKDSGGIEILVDMARRGELDPKNIDIIDATDRFLKAIAAAPRENLRQSGKIIFHASVLLRMKAEALLITKIEELDQGGDDFIDFDLDGSPIIYDSNDEAVGRQITLADLQRALVRRSRQRQSRQRKVTLEQLIESLREAELQEKKRRERKEREPHSVIRMDGYNAIDDMDDILDLAHDEDIEDVIVRIEALLVQTMEEMMRLSLSKLIGMLDGRGDWVDAFLAVLFLANVGKVNLEQEVFYGPLYLVRGGKPESSPDDSGAPGAAAGLPAGALVGVETGRANLEGGAPEGEIQAAPPLPFARPVKTRKSARAKKAEETREVRESNDEMTRS